MGITLKYTQQNSGKVYVSNERKKQKTIVYSFPLCCATPIRIYCPLRLGHHYYTMLRDIRKEPEKHVRLTLKAYHLAHKKSLMTKLIGVLV